MSFTNPMKNQNYLDSRTPEERAKDSEVEYTLTTSTNKTTQWREWEKKFNQLTIENEGVILWSTSSQLKSTIKSFIASTLSTTLELLEKEVEVVIAQEMNICHKEGQATSRLASAFNRIGDLFRQHKGK